MSTLFPYLFAALGIGLVVYAAYAFNRTQNLIAHCLETNARITDLKYSSGGGNEGPTYSPVFEFQTATGESITVQSAVGSSPSGFRIGQSVRVRYDPADPSNAKIHTFFQTWGDSILPALVGIGFLAFVFYDIFGTLNW